MVLQADHASSEDCARVSREAIELSGRIDALFNNAGVVLRGTSETTTEKEWAETLALNVTAPWLMSRFLIPHMRENGGGVIVNNSSDWVSGSVGRLNYAIFLNEIRISWFDVQARNYILFLLLS
jgi:NAD(P)-dependent dehydrogenase (short-subunit alcohol dehydrogenase family)